MRICIFFCNFVGDFELLTKKSNKDMLKFSGKTRVESDLIGELQIPVEALYGVQTMRGIENFPISKFKLQDYPAFINGLAYTKLGAAMANHELGLLTDEQFKAIKQACEEILQGQWHEHFPVDMIQGGAGTTTNMNANEVIANRALQIMGHEPGEYQYCSPNDHVNCSQSTNDAYPAAIHMGLYATHLEYMKHYEMLIDSFQKKADEFKNVLKMGRTQLEDAVPMTLGQTFGAFASILRDEVKHLNDAAEEFLTVNMGATAIGTGICSEPGYSDKCVKAMAEVKPNVVFTVPLVLEKIYSKMIVPMISRGALRWALAVPYLDKRIYGQIRNKLIEAFGGEFEEVIVGGAPFNAEVEDFLYKIKFERPGVEAREHIWHTMIPELRECFPDCMRVTFSIALIDWATMPVYYANFMQMMKQMVSESNQVTFRGCPSGELLAPYGQAFRLMNPKAVYLRQDPMGYHEKAFGLFLPFPLDKSEIMINIKSYLPLWLDALDHPEHYDGKVIHFADPIELRRKDEDSPWTCGRIVMTCCMADLQFMSFELDASSTGEEAGVWDKTHPAGNSWITLDASAKTVSDSYGQRKLLLVPERICPADPPDELILDGRKA